MGSGTFDWNSPQFQNSTYFKWNQEGDSIEGVIVGMSSTTFPAKGVPGDADYSEARTYPVLCIDTALGERELTVSNVDLLTKTIAKNPQEGDWYGAAWVATAGKKRIFTVQVKKAPAQALSNAQQAAADGRHYPAVDVDTLQERAARAGTSEVPF